MRVGAKLVADDDADFQRFWAAYPKHLAKKEARQAWAQLRPTAEMVTQMLEALDWQRRSAQWQRGFIPHAATWLRAERWADEPSEPEAVRQEPYHWADCTHDPKCGTARECADRKSGRR